MLQKQNYKPLWLCTTQMLHSYSGPKKQDGSKMQKLHSTVCLVKID